jgi:ribosome-associated protein
MDGIIKVYDRDFSSELDFTTSRSSGPGGQNVNKVNTKVTLRFDIDASQQLNEQEKDTLKEKLANKISNDAVLIIASEATRSQLKNKEEAISKFYGLLKKTFQVRKKRKPTKPKKSAIEKRLKEKQKQSEKKQYRQKGDF